MKPQVTIETWTPAAAKKELAEQEKRIAIGDYRNRNVNMLTVKRYANDMRQGHWLVNNQGLGWDESGNLLDGRHRLWGCVESGVSVDFLCFRGLEARKNGSGLQVNPIDTIDCGRVRTVANQFAIDGIKYSIARASVVRSIGMLASHPKRVKFSAVPARGTLKYYESEIDNVVKTMKDRRIRNVFAGPIAIYMKSRPRKGAEFLTGLSTLIGLKEGSPVLALDTYIRAHAGLHSGRHENDCLLASALALFHFENDTNINVIRHSQIGAEWLQKFASNDINVIRKFLGWEKQ